MLTAREMAEWEAYNRLEPFGQPRGDMQAGIIAAALARAHAGGKGPDPRSFSIDAMIEKDLGPADEAEAKAMAQRQLESFRGIAERSKREQEAKARGESQKPRVVRVPMGQEPPGRVRRSKGRRR